MLKKVTYSIISFSMLATSLGMVNANAEESSKSQSTSEKGTMGYGYQQYLKKHPNQKSNATQNRSTFSTKSRSAVTNTERVLDISEWQGNLTDAQVKNSRKIMTSSLYAASMVQNM